MINPLKFNLKYTEIMIIFESCFEYARIPIRERIIINEYTCKNN